MTTRVLGTADRGSRLDVDTGDTVEVHLPANASTGFQWSVAALPGGVELIDETLDAGPGALPGAAAQHRFRFAVRGPADGEVTIELRRSWERLEQPDDLFAVRLASRPRREANTPPG